MSNNIVILDANGQQTLATIQTGDGSGGYSPSIKLLHQVLWYYGLMVPLVEW